MLHRQPMTRNRFATHIGVPPAPLRGSGRSTDPLTRCHLHVATTCYLQRTSGDWISWGVCTGMMLRQGVANSRAASATRGFETQDGCGDSSVHLRATLTGCGHSFCSPCLAEILRFQGVHCSELGGAASQSCSNCQREQFKTSSRGGAGDDHDVVLRQCKGWAPCPLCRNPYCEEQVVVSRTH